ncbi:hypothetical protein, partial [Xanthomonas sacchari]|uniref:hypothetical protein n=1 Tax=Xanthomonas sacchari TaxID=56458 RepID=UPI001ABFA123
GFGIRDSGFGIRDSGFGIRDSGFGIRDSQEAAPAHAGVKQTDKKTPLHPEWRDRRMPAAAL